MPGIYQYIVPLPVTAESNETLIAKKVIRVLDCSTNLENEAACSLWNYTHCPSDSDYCNPFVIGDVLYLQKFLVTKDDNISVSVSVIDTESEQAIVTNDLTVQYGKDNKGITFGNIIFDTSNVASKCFFLKIRIFNCKLRGTELEEYNACVASYVDAGKTLQEAQDICKAEFCEETLIYSEPFCKATCQNTILLEGVYPRHDCYGYYYAPFISNPKTNSYKNQIRVFGEINSNGFTIDEVTLNGLKRTSTTLGESFLIRTKGIPYYVANKIATIFAAKDFYVDGVQYFNSVDLQKNNDENNMWFISTTVNTQCGPNDFSCNT